MKNALGYKQVRYVLLCAPGKDEIPEVGGRGEGTA